MKLATFCAQGGEPQLGLVEGSEMFALPAGGDWPADMQELIGNWNQVQSRIATLQRETCERYPLSGVELLAPIARPSKIMGIALNYSDYIAEAGVKAPKDQIWFAKQPRSAAGPFADIELPSISDCTDWEAELVVVMGQGTRNMSPEQARAAIFGYAVGNDVSVRDMQSRTSQLFIGKAFDTHAPFGPWITTADEIENPENLGIRCLVNGATMQNSNTGNLIHKIVDQIMMLSSIMTLDPGDLIFTGTPGGVGNAQVPPVFLQHGDIVRCEIDQLGHIENRFARLA